MGDKPPCSQSKARKGWGGRGSSPRLLIKLVAVMLLCPLVCCSGGNNCPQHSELLPLSPQANLKGHVCCYHS